VILAKHLTGSDIEKILGILDGWQGKLTWDGLCDACAIHIGKRPTRQSLNSHGRIKQAFSDKKTQSTIELKDVRTPPSLAIAGQRISRLEEECTRLKNENTRLLEQFLVWQYNTYRHGLSEGQLNNPLPKIDRES
jgi:hypothetical protein